MESREVTIGNKGATQSQQFAWYCLCFLVLVICTKQALAETPVTLKQSFAGNLSFTVTGASFRPRSNSNGNGACFTNSSASAAISDVPTGANVIAAYLFWAGSGAPDYQVTLNGQTVSADFSSRHTYQLDSNRRFYGGSADITSRISNPNRSYTLRNLSIEDNDNYCDTETVLGAWSIAVIYETPTEDFRVVNIYEGFQAFSGSTPTLTLIPSNFKLPANPTGKHAHITWEGDDNLNAGGENLEFEGALLSDSNNPSGNQFNSYSNVQGGSNTYGLDVDAYDISNYLTPGDEQVVTRYSSGQDLVILSSEIISVSNIPVADVSIEPTNISANWQVNSIETVELRVRNLGPADVLASDTRITLNLPSSIVFSGNQPLGWSCTSNSIDLTCVKDTTLLAGSSNTVTIELDTSSVDTSSGTVLASFQAEVDHDLASTPDLFDNRINNNSINFDVSVIPLDYSSSNANMTDNNLGLFIAGDPILYTLTLSESSPFNIQDASIAIDVPANISGVTIDSIPDGANASIIENGGVNGTGQVIVSDIGFSDGESPQIELTFLTDSSLNPGTNLSTNATITDNGDTWVVSSNTLTVTDGSQSSSGNKQLYLDTSGNLSRLRPNNTAGNLDVDQGGSYTWTLSPTLLDNLTFDSSEIDLELVLSGNGTINFFGTLYPYEATYNLEFNLLVDGSVIASSTNSIALDNGTPIAIDIQLANVSGSNPYTIPSGSTVQLQIENNSTTGGGFFQITPNAVTLEIFSADSTRIADGYSALILDSSTVIDVESVTVWSRPFDDTNNDGTDDSGAQIIGDSQPDTTLSIRANVSDPFGAFDITSATISIVKSNGDVVFGNTPMIEIEDYIDDFTTNSKSFEATFDLAEENEITGYWSISITANEGVEGDVSNTQSLNFLIKPFQPNVTLSKTIKVINDPINGSLEAGNNPKAIPGAEIQYTISAINTGRGKSDTNSIVLQDEIPQNAELFIGDLACSNRGPGNGLGPVCFENGAAPNESGLTYDFASTTDLTDDIAFSVDGSNFSYEPVDDGDGYDSDIRFIRISPSGELLNANKEGTEQPEFSFQYQVRLQ